MTDDDGQWIIGNLKYEFQPIVENYLRSSLCIIDYQYPLSILSIKSIFCSIESFFECEDAFIERFADNDAIDAVGLEFFQRIDVVERGDAA